MTSAHQILHERQREADSETFKPLAHFFPEAVQGDFGSLRTRLLLLHLPPRLCQQRQVFRPRWPVSWSQKASGLVRRMACHHARGTQSASSNRLFSHGNINLPGQCKQIPSHTFHLPACSCSSAATLALSACCSAAASSCSDCSWSAAAAAAFSAGPCAAASWAPSSS